MIDGDIQVRIIKATEANLEDCREALINSELGRRYFTSDSAKEQIAEGISREEIRVAIDSAGQCIGFVWGIAEGAFHGYPYLHILAVKEGYRAQGVGRQLIRYFEDVMFEKAKKVFLVVADFNPDAKRFYERLGYVEVGKIPDLYRPGITEYLMMKCK